MVPTVPTVYLLLNSIYTISTQYLEYLHPVNLWLTVPAVYNNSGVEISHPPVGSCAGLIYGENICAHHRHYNLQPVSRVVIIVIMPVFSCDRLMIDTSLT